MEFQSTLSVRRATFSAAIEHHLLAISIHALRKESDSFVTVDFPDIRISIHALRKESDCSFSSFISIPFNFNPRSP